MKRPHHAPDEKVRIIMESINTHITPAELCRKHNINPASFTRWRDIFFECGKAGIKNRIIVMRIKSTIMRWTS